MSKTIVVKCPICKSLVKRENDYFPFCCERCKTNDLGNWASNAYSIPDSHAHDPDEDESRTIH